MIILWALILQLYLRPVEEQTHQRLISKRKCFYFGMSNMVNRFDHNNWNIKIQKITSVNRE